jgi:hypothetical protein
MALTLTALLAGSFIWFVWPTRFSYYEQTQNRGPTLLVRTNRFTGRTEFLYPGLGWVTSTLDRYEDAKKEAPPGWEPVPSEAVKAATR